MSGTIRAGVKANAGFSASAIRDGEEVGVQQIAPLVLGGPGGNNLATTALCLAAHALSG